MTLGRGMGWLIWSKHFPQSILQVGPQKPRDGPGSHSNSENFTPPVS